MKKFYFTTFIFLISFFYTNAQITFQQRYGIGNGNLFTFFGSAIQTSDQGYLMTGTGIGLGSYEIDLVKVDTAGLFQWAKAYHSGSWLSPYSDEYGVSRMIASSDGNYVLCGSREANFFLMKIDPSGNIIWAKDYDKAGGDTLYSVKQTSDGGYIAVGQTRLSANDSLDAYILKVNASGTYQWGATWTNATYNSNDVLYDVTEDPGVGYIATGYLSEVFNGGNDTTTDILVIKTDLNGNLSWGKAFGEDGDNEEAHYILRDGSNYYITGYTEKNAFGTDVFFLQMNNAGTISSVHSYDYGLTDMSNKIIKNTNSDFVLFGMDPFSSNIFQLTVNALGTFQSGYDYSGNYSFAITVDGQQTADGGLMMGTMASDYSYYLFKTNPTGSSGCYENSLSLGTTTLSFTSTNADNGYTTGGSGGSPSVSADAFTIDTTIVDCAFIPCDTPVVTVTPSNPTICDGQSQTLTASGSNSSGNCDSWSWSTSENTASINVSPSSQTTYTVTGYVGSCPSNPVNVTVNVNPTPTPSISGNASVCENSTGEIYTTTNNSGNTYTWSISGGTIVSGNGTNTISVNWGSTSGTVSVTEDNGSCSATDNFSVTVVPAPSVDAGANDTVCEGNSITLTGTASNYSSLQWTTSGDGTFSSPTNISTGYIPGNTDATNGTVTITLTAHGNGTCGDVSDNLTLIVIPNATVNAGTANDICADETIPLNASGSNYTTIHWTTSGDGTFSDASILNPIYTPGANDMSNGSVTLTITATNDPQCNPATDNLTVNIYPVPSVIAGSSAAACEGVDINLTETGGDADTWVWSGPNSFSSGLQNPTVYSPDATASGWYVVTASISGTGCSSTDSVQVTVNANPTIFIAGDTSLCNGDSTILTASGADTYLWNTTDTVNSITVTPPLGQTSYDVTGTNLVTGCSSNVSVVVGVHPIPNADAGQDTTICYSNTATLHATGGTTYQWSPTGTLNNYTLQNPYATPLDTTTYYVTVTNDWNCSAVDSVTVNVLEGPDYNIYSSDVQCPNGNDGYAYVGDMNGVNPITYEWSTSATDTIINNLIAGNYSLTISDGIGCHYYEQVTINEPNEFTDSTIVTNVACYGDNTGAITTYISGGTTPYTFAWSNNETTQTIFNLSAGYYSATITDSHNCTYNIDSLHITQPSTSVSFSDTTADASCYGSSDGFAMVTATGGTEPYQYMWSTDDTTSSIAFISAGTYYVTIEDNHNCTTFDTLHISQPTPIVIHAHADSTSCIDGADGSIQVIVTGGIPPYNYLWSESVSTDSIAENLTAGIYNLTITDAHSCESIAEVPVEASPNECLKIPELITPNNDGHNDTWEITGIGNYDQVSIEIFNRWGNKIFTFDGTGIEYADPANQWDGSYKGRKKLGMQSFIYILDVHNGREPFQGIVTVKD